jgi:hypothetical protein
MSAPKRDWETKEPLSSADALRLTRELFEEAERTHWGGHEAVVGSRGRDR